MGMCHCTEAASDRNSASLDPSLRLSLGSKVQSHPEECKDVFALEGHPADLNKSPERGVHVSLPLSPESVSFQDVYKLSDNQHLETGKGTEAETPINSEPLLEDSGEEMDFRAFILARLTRLSREAYLSLAPFFYLGQSPSQQLTALSNGAIYFGETDFANLPHGFGLRIDSDSTLLEGIWENGSLHGTGLHLYPNGDYYQGDFRRGEVEGLGKFVRLAGSSYEGEWKDSRQNGQGTETWGDGSVYVGAFVQGKKQGKGCFRWANGASYEGEFWNNHLEGVGTYTWGDGRVYQGTWVKNKMHGRGKFTWPDGKVYQGEYLADRRHGTGTFHWPNGRYYTGAWEGNKMNGFGVLTDREGVSVSGEWQNGSLVSLPG